RSITLAAVISLLAAAAAVPGGQRASLLPKLQPGQSFTYLVRWRGDKKIKTDSSFAVPMAPAPSQVDALGLLRIEILDLQSNNSRLTVRARGQFLLPEAVGKAANPAAQKSGFTPQLGKIGGESIEFTISIDGSVDKIIGFEALSPDEQQIWQAWV